ncbi:MULTISPECIES: hypothetical protein [unclassified Streptomyces]|uniref:hypothetical protein n=1 Tax=unclassified Streptomyces TaxID=2593676 RepID=UPI00344D0482
MSLRVPATAVTIGGVGPARTGDDTHLRSVRPLPAILAALIRGFLALGAGWT